MNRLLLTLSLLFIFSPAPALAQDPLEGVVQEEDNLYRKVLDNGLEVIVLEDASLPLVTIEIAVRNGAFTEDPKYDGLSHLYEHMFFKGNAAIPNQEAYLARQRELGLMWNGTTNTERVNYFFSMTSERLEDGLVFMRDAIRDPLFDQEELERERLVVLDELSRNETDPFFHLRKAIDNALWYAFPSRKNVIGDREIIATATREKMLTVQKKFYIPNNAALFIAGAVDRAHAFHLAETLYGDWAPGDDPFEADPIPEHPPLTEDVAVVTIQPANIVVFTLAWHGPDTESDRKATYAADVFTFILSQRSSIFTQNLVESGLALYAGIGYLTQKHVGPITLTVSCTPDKAEAALKAVLAEIERFDDPDYFTDDQIETAKTLLEVYDIYDREKTSEFTHTLSFWWSSAGLDYYLTYIENLKAVTREDMVDYAQTYIIGQPRVVGVLVNEANQAVLQLTPEKVLQWMQP